MSPNDTFFVSKRFLNHWKPDLACKVESEIWPRILFELKKGEAPNYLQCTLFKEKLILDDIPQSNVLLSFLTKTCARKNLKEIFARFIHQMFKNVMKTFLFEREFLNQWKP